METTRAFILGAGASRAYGESPTCVRPPLANDFFTTFNALDISGDLYVRVGDIVNYVRDTRGVPAGEFGAWNENVETFLTEIEETIGRLRAAYGFGKIPLEELHTPSRAYTQMIFLFTSILNEIQNGPPSEAYARFAGLLGRGDTVMSFNWDTLLDRVLADTGRWNVDSGYGVRVDGIYEDGWREADSAAPEPELLLLKLHGSTNWLTGYEGFRFGTGQMWTICSASLGRLYCYAHSTRPYPTYRGRWRDGYEPFSYYYYPPNIPLPPDPAREGYARVAIDSTFYMPEYGEVTVDDPNTYSIPLIVAPVRNKQYARHGEVFHALWDRAEEALRQCGKLYVIGYSFPPTDEASRSMCRRAFAERATPPCTVVINPEPERVVEALLSVGADASRVHVLAERFDGSFPE